MSRSMNFDVTATDNAEATFLRIAQAAERLDGKLAALDRRRVEPTIQANIGPATRSLQQLQTRLAALRNVRAAVAVDGVAEARREVTALVVELRKIRDTRARVQLDVGTARADITAIADRLRALRDARVRVSLDTGTVPRDIARLHQRISALNGTTVRIHIEVTPPGIREELEGIARALREIRDTRVTVTANTGGATSAVRQLGAELGRLGKVGAIGLSIPGLIATTGQVASLGGAVMSLTGVLGLLPAAGSVAAAGIGTLVVGLQGFGDAMAARDDAEKFAEAIAKLSPAAREAAVTVRDLGGSWGELRLDVQERLFAGLGDTISQVSSAYLPGMRVGLGGIAEELNVGAKSFAAWASEGRTVADVNTILGNTRTTMRELAPAGQNVAAALLDVSVVGSAIMPELAAGATEATGRFREFVAEARRTGELEQWIRNGIDTMAQLGRIAGDTGGILGSVFTASQTAGYDFLDMVEQVTSELDALLSSRTGQDALVAVFRESGQVVDALLPGMRDLSTATLQTVAAFANNDGVAEFAGAVSNAATAISPLVAQLGALAGGTLQSLAGGAGVATAALSPLVGAAAAVAGGLGPLPGLVLASVVAFKGLGLATASMAALGTRIAATSAAAGLYATAITGSMAAGSAANTAVTRLGGAVTALGRALPYVGVAAIAAGAALDLFSVSTAEAVDAMSQGGAAADRMRDTLAQQTGVVAGLDAVMGSFFDVNALGIGTLQSVADATAQQEREMTGLERAQRRASETQGAYQLALDETGPTSQRTADAARELAAATDAVEAEQRAAGQATQSHTDAMRDQVSAAQSALGANLDLAAAARALAEAEEAANAAIREHGAGSEEAAIAVEQLTRVAMQQAEAVRQVAVNQAEAAGSTNAAAAGEAAYAASLLNTAATLDGPARAAVLGQIATLSDAELAALSAGAAATGFATQLLTLPDGRTVTIAVDPETGEIISTQQLLDGMADADVAVNVETAAALAGLEGFLGTVNGAAGTVSINGNPQAAGSALVTVLGQIAAGAATVTINGQSVPAGQALSAIIGQIGASGAQVTIGGQSLPASQVLSSTLGAIRAGRADVTIGGQRYPADAVLRALLGSVSGSSAALTILGRDGGVAALKGRLAAPSSSTHTIYVRQVGRMGANPQGGLQAHDGLIAPAQRYRTGGVAPAARAFAGGGTARPFRAGTAQIFPPRLLRITGDRTDVDEFYIPDNRAPRSMALGAEWARRRGMNLVPRNTSSTIRSAVAQARRSLGTTGARSGPGPSARPTVPVLGEARGTGVALAPAPVDLRPLAAELRSFVRDALGGADQSAVVAAVDRLGHQLAAPRAMSAEGHRLAGTDGIW